MSERDDLDALGTALNAGPVVRFNVPAYTPPPVFGAVADSHKGVPSAS